MASQGRIVIPKKIRERAGIAAGDKLQISVKEGKVQLKKATVPKYRAAKIKINKRSGMPYFDVPKDAPPITLEWIKERMV